MNNSYEVGKINHPAKYEEDQHEAITVYIRAGQWNGRTWGLSYPPIALTVSQGSVSQGSISITAEEAKELARILTTAVEKAPEIAAKVLAVEERRADLDEVERTVIASLMQAPLTQEEESKE